MILFTTVILISLVAVVTSTAAAADVVPAACGPLDPAVDGDGQIIISPTDGYGIDRLTVDAQGRVYVNTIRVVNDSFVLDRIRRYLPDGSPDTTWGTSGFVDVSDRAFSVQSRTMAVDEKGRLWFARATYANELELRRFNPDGTVDTSLSPILFYEPRDLWDPVGDMVANGTGVTLAYGLSNNGDSTPRMYSVIEDGQNFIYASSIEQNTGMNVLDVTSEGLVVGQVYGAGFAWKALGLQNIERSVSESFYVGLGEVHGDTLIYGVVNDAGERKPLTARLGPGDSRNLTETVTTTGADGVQLAHVDTDGAAIGFRDNTMVFGQVGTDGIFTPDPGANPVPRAVASLAVPIAVQKLPDGSRVIAHYVDYANNQMAITRTLPTNLGPAVSDRALADQIGRLYSAYFLRPADAAGLLFWMRSRAQGASLQEVSDAFAGSTEFTNRYGSLADGDFVTLVYRNVLGREPEPAGLDFWMSQLTSGAMSRGQVMVGFSESAEYIRRTATVAPHRGSTGAVHRLYRAYFQRDSDDTGLCYWSRLVDGGAPLVDVSQAFAGSAEFATTYGSLTDRQFVELVYQNVLGRAGDADGVAFWTSQLTSGAMNRGEVMLNFSESPENILRTGTLPA